VTLTSVDGLVRLEVRDDGAGFDPAGDFPGHLGLVSMRERARRIGATYAIESSPGKGATVTLTVPAG
jgi:signal transduction histidine kinase